MLKLIVLIFMKMGFYCLVLDSVIKIVYSVWCFVMLILLFVYWFILLYINLLCCFLEENKFFLICFLNICFKLFRNLFENLFYILECNVYFVVCMSCLICRKKRIIKILWIKKKLENVLIWIIYVFFCNGKSFNFSY